MTLFPTMMGFCAPCRNSSRKTTYLQGRGTGRKMSLSEAGSLTPELGAMDMCTFFMGAGPELL